MRKGYKKEAFSVRKALKEARRKKGLSPKNMADKLNISLSFYYKIESGTRNPTLLKAKEIAEILGKSIEEIFFEDEYK